MSNTEFSDSFDKMTPALNTFVLSNFFIGKNISLKAN